MSCSSCKYLEEKNKKEGRANGCCYYCSKTKTYVNGQSNGCENYQRTYARNNYECDKIYNDGEKYSDDDTPISFYITLLVILVILAVIINI